MSYRVKIENFDGPFELLLSLVSKDKVDIGSISITEIADQYLAEIQRLKVLVAATLLEIKAQSLLPKPQIELDEDVAELSPNEARDILVERLMNYKKYKNAAGALYERFEAEGRMHSRPFGPEAVFLQVMPDFLKGVTTDALGLMAAGSYARREVFLLESEHIAAKPLPVEVHVRAIHQRIRNKKHLKFSELVTEDTPTEVLVVTFLALLELFKRAMVHLNQPNPFGDIMVDYIEGSGELVLDEQHGLTSIEE